MRSETFKLIHSFCVIPAEAGIQYYIDSRPRSGRGQALTRGNDKLSEIVN